MIASAIQFANERGRHKTRAERMRYLIHVVNGVADRDERADLLVELFETDGALLMSGADAEPDLG